MRLSKVVIAGLVAGVLSCAGIVLVVPPFRWIVIKPHYPPGYEDLMDAIENRSPKRVKEILDTGVDPNRYPHTEEDYSREVAITPLNYALEKGQVSVVSLLLNHGADPNMGDQWHGSPLAVATDSDNVDLLKVLIHAGAKVNEDKNGSYALWHAAMSGKEISVRYLLSQGALANTKTDGQPSETLLHALRSAGGYPKIERILAKHGAKDK